ncbi:TonB-dependent receptor plug domain-containing protein [Novosphingobium naphthalenivorans]|uniref:TonB-dependent receptor plug domain-containing protein n=1 Tax=Novosphingobium naphthalenivorans TaxID=273168 RepID=UPI00082E68AE|nr:TonB-dependent receptor [Novosphingobium naphthalenivorans]
MKYKGTASIAALAVGLCACVHPALAQSAAGMVASGAEAAAASDEDVGDAIIVTGTRTTGMKAADSPAPIQIMEGEALARTGQPDLIQGLAQSLPTIQAQSFGSDMQAMNLQMKLRGLSPNHTLILINGKRRHGTANVAVSGGPYGGGAAPDMSFIPPEAIGHVEVLQDGAAAQYGTDAIAGVINIILKDQDSGGSFSATAGQYMDEGGDTYSVSANVGFAPVENSFVNLTVQKKKKGFSFRGNYDPRVYGPVASYLSRYPAVVDQSDYPYVNRIEGDPEIFQTVGTLNAGYNFGDYQLYFTGSYGHKYAHAYENYRTPDRVALPDGTLVYPTGFSPLEAVRETDYAATMGFKGPLGEGTFDIASTYGHDLVKVYVENTGNGSMAADFGYTPTEFHDGDFKSSQFTNTLDVTYPIEVGFAEPMTLAGGLEWRRDMYGINAGDAGSYYGSGAQSFFGYSPNDAGKYHRTNFAQYLDVTIKPTDKWLIDGAVRHEHYSDFGDTTVFKLTSRYDFSPMFAIRGTASTGFRAPTLGESFYSGINVGPNAVSGVLPANSAAAASLGFGGLKPEKSTNFSAGIVFTPTPKVSFTLDAYWIKIRDRIMISSSFYGFRGAYCPADYSGSNASSCKTYVADDYNIYNQQAVYDAVSTALGGSIPSYVLYDSSLGNGTDTRNINGTVTVQTFVNGADMTTKGIDFAAHYDMMTSFGPINWSFAANYNENKVDKIAALPSALYTSTVDASKTALINKYTVWQLEKSTPKVRATLGAYWESGMFSVNLRESFYSKVSSLTTAPSNCTCSGDITIPVNSAFITDLELGFKPTENLKVSFGANNLFNHYPTKTRQDVMDAYLSTSSTSYATQKYPSISPFGINGGYYYGRVNVTF